MRTGRRLTWMIFAVCALLVIDGLGWVTWQLLSLERREREAQARAQRQEAVRLALWRMDGLLSPLIAAEAARPYFQYRSFYPAERAYARMWEPVEAGEALEPSPLLSGPGRFIRLHFEGSPDGWLTSPQAPDQELRNLAGGTDAPLSEVLESERRLLELTALMRGSPGPATRKLGDSAGQVRDELLAERNQQLQQLAQEPPPTASLPSRGIEAEAAQDEESTRSIVEYQARQQAVDSARNLADASDRLKMQAATREELADRAGPGEAGRRDAPLADSGASPEAMLGAMDGGEVTGGLGPAARSAVQTWPFTSVWLRAPGGGEPELLFIRVVRVEGIETLQGFWVDWPELRAALLESVRDLLPGAALQPLIEGDGSGVAPASRGPGPIDAGRLLAGVPATLVPGASPASALAGLTPTRTVLVVAWLAVVAAIVAIAMVLRASLSLSERRGRFVSAVTHELRTPLTTFCLYSQMLADGMVREESRRGEYLGTLRRESERLAGIVENVLAYARMGGGRREGVRGQRVADLLGGVLPSLRERASQEGLALEAEEEEAGDTVVAADEGSLGRILGNLVDNACKYGASGSERRVVLRVREVGGGVEFRVRDFGPGVPRRERRRIFSPFVRARTHGGDGSSGLGLGLALARGVARSLGGDLRLARPAEPGAEFVLWLPREGPGVRRA